MALLPPFFLDTVVAIGVGDDPGKRYQKLQIITIEELLNGKQLEYPRMWPEVTFKEAERKGKGNKPEQMKLE